MQAGTGHKETDRLPFDKLTSDDAIHGGKGPLPASGGSDLTTGSILRHLVTFSIPMMVGSLIQTAYSVVNAIWVGKGIGEEAMAAITVSFPVIFLLMAVIGGLSMGASVLVSQNYGAKKFDQVTNVINNSMVVAVVTSLMAVAAGYIGVEPLLRTMGTPADVLPLAVGYMNVFIWTVPGMFGLFLQAACLRGAGDARTPIYFQTGGLLFTAILDPFLIFGLAGLPRLGLNGTAFATVIAQMLTFLSMMWYLVKKQHVARPVRTGFRIDPATILGTLKIGVPSMIQQALISLGMATIISLVNGFGKEAVAAMGAATRLDSLAFLPSMTLHMAISMTTGQNIGAGKPERVRETFKWGLLLSLVCTLPATLLALAFPGQILRLFLQDPVAIAVGIDYLRVMAIAYLLFSAMSASNGIINGAGKTFVTTVVTVVGLWVVRVPMAMWLAKTPLGLKGIWFSICFSASVGMGLSVLYYLSGRWLKRAEPRPTPMTPEPIPE